MNIKKTVNEKTLTLRLEGWLDTKAAEELQAQLDTMDADTESLVLDLEGLEYIASAGLRQFVAAHKRMGGAMTLTHVRQEIMDVLRMAGFDKRLHIDS